MQDTYKLLKGQNTHKKPGQKYPSKVGVSFNTVGENNGEALVNDGTKRTSCSRYGCINHIVDKCYAKKHDDGTMLHKLGEMKEVESERNNEVST